MTEGDVTTYMTKFLGSITASITLSTDALTQAANLVQAVYGDTYANFTDELKWRILADFFAINSALNFAVSFYKFSADGAIIEGSQIYQHLLSRWNAALSMAQTYLTDAGLVVVAPGSPLTPKNYGWQLGTLDTNHLTELVE